MTEVLKALKDFRSLKITATQLRNKFGGNLFDVDVDRPVIIDNTNLIFCLDAVKNGRLLVPDLVDWVNIIWFTDLFNYSDKYADSIASVMTELEELDEKEFDLPVEQIDRYISVLEKNEEYV